MRLSQAVSPAEKIIVPFANDAKLEVMYRPASYTPNELDRMQEEAREKGKTKRGMKSLVTSMRNMIVSWDLTDDNDVPISLEAPAVLLDEDGSTRYEPKVDDDGKPMFHEDGSPVFTDEPLTEPDPMMDVPINVYMGVMKQVNTEQQAGEA